MKYIRSFKSLKYFFQKCFFKFLLRKIPSCKRIEKFLVLVDWWCYVDVEIYMMKNMVVVITIFDVWEIHTTIIQNHLNNASHYVHSHRHIMKTHENVWYCCNMFSHAVWSIGRHCRCVHLQHFTWINYDLSFPWLANMMHKHRKLHLKWQFNQS